MLADLTGATEPVSSKKNLFEAGEAWNQNAVSVTSSKVKDEVHFNTSTSNVDCNNSVVGGGGETGHYCSKFISH